MGITLKGHDINFQYWVFDIDGRDWIAINQSTEEPLKIQFQGRYGNWGTGNLLTKAAGFDILSSTTSKTGLEGEKQGVVEWIWKGSRYKSTWVLTPGTEIIAGDPAEGIESIWDYQLGFVGRIPYDGPTGGAVGTGGVTNTQSPPPAAIPPIVPSLPIDQNTNIMGGGQDQVRIPTPVISTTPVIPATSVTTAPVTGTDWVKLGIQLGVAYFILS
jgi:hypothetical protein